MKTKDDVLVEFLLRTVRVTVWSTFGDRFFRGGDPNTRRTRGTGLGLAVVREILKLHDAALEIESQEGQGSRFSFFLPAVRAAAATA